MMETLQTTTAPFEESKELEVAHVRVQNANGARTILYSVTITARVRRENEAMLQEFLENRKATLNDAISRIIRSTDEKHLAEPGLETLKRQVRFELSNLIGDDTVIEQILIPEFTPLPTGF
jgi:flagellar basal body-associated protein FliL